MEIKPVYWVEQEYIGLNKNYLMHLVQIKKLVLIKS